MHKNDPSGIAINHALLQLDATIIIDQEFSLLYSNLLHTQIGAVCHAITVGMTKGVKVTISKIELPSLKLVAEGKGMPLMLKVSLRVFIFVLFNENLKLGSTSERNYMLFKTNGTLAYQLGFILDNSTIGGGGAAIGGGYD
ncbi:putative Glucan endo-1,3-beta-glucosidase 11 [Cocos nucifera]|uniref:Putative Glucan endo-1,3-beta-glucosidase 11 n=1 Tax=Cocos nucifera TaxID=13894 RepID=A0A8K0IL09_COCNU|nr:putative Glucan endo-1,3-beta-glucosidase 11 [Cocos nucifera]